VGAGAVPGFACAIANVGMLTPMPTQFLRFGLALILNVLFAVATHAAEQTPPQVPDTLEQRLLACATCHGKHGEGVQKNEAYPRLAGKPDGYLYNQLLNFRERRRHYDVMNYMLGYLSDAYLREIAQYYAGLRPPYPARPITTSSEVLARGEALAKRGDPARKLPACVECHGTALTGLAPAIPGLVGLSPFYIGQQMGAWRARQRRAKEPDCMAHIAALLGPEEISAVAAWLAAQPPPAGVPAKLSEPGKLPLECGSVAQR
jgi:cytochrome c553